jgi:hypothetical protein
MNTLKTLSLIVLLSAATIGMAKPYDDFAPVTKSSPYKKFVHLNPFALLVGGLEFGYEATQTPKQCLLMNFGYYNSKEAGGLDIKDDYSNMSGLKIDMQYRFYRKTNNYIRNVYIAPYFNFKTISADRNYRRYTYAPNYNYVDSTAKHSATTVSVGYMVGYRKSIFENIYMDLGIGGGMFIPVSGENHSDVNIPLFSPYNRGVQFKAHIGFGIAL